MEATAGDALLALADADMASATLPEVTDPDGLDQQAVSFHLEATESERFPRLLAVGMVGFHIQATGSDLFPARRPVLTELRKDGTGSSLGDVLIFPDMIQYRPLTNFDVDNFVEEVLLKENGWSLGSPGVITGSYVFVCCHGSRDERCGVCGPALVEKFEEINGQVLAGSFIIFSSDAKGEVTGCWYGYVAPDDVPVMPA